jgi:hypothetical protein
MKERNWSGRAFTSLCSLLSFILLCNTGIILYIEPHGRVAYWIKWHFLNLEKDQWGNIHVYSGLLFLIAGGFHIYYNWKPLVEYLSGKIKSVLRYKRELLISSVIQRLKAIDFDAKEEDRLKSLADKNITTPIKLVTTILIENSQIESEF